MRKSDPDVPDTYVDLITKAYRRYKGFWINLARTSLITKEDGEDIVHGVVGSILARRDIGFESLEHVRNYVARAVLNRAIQIRQRAVRVCEFEEEVSIEIAPLEQVEILERQEERAALRAVINGLSRQDYEIIKLRFFSGLTFIEISRMLQKPVSTLKSREDAALRRIRKDMQKRVG